MSLAFQRAKVYVRLTLVVLLAVAIGAVLFMNRRNEVAVWFFWLTDESKRINVVWLMLCTAGAALLSWWVFSFSMSLWRDMRKLRKQDALRDQETELKKREADLAHRERLVDGKIERSLQAGEVEGKEA